MGQWSYSTIKQQEIDPNSIGILDEACADPKVMNMAGIGTGFFVAQDKRIFVMKSTHQKEENVWNQELGTCKPVSTREFEKLLVCFDEMGNQLKEVVSIAKLLNPKANFITNNGAHSAISMSLESLVKTFREMLDQTDKLLSTPREPKPLEALLLQKLTDTALEMELDIEQWEEENSHEDK